MILGLGNDIIEISRIDRAIKRYGQKFLDKVFTPQEQKYCLKYSESERHFSGRFAAKEAIVKALGSGFREGITWLDIEIVNDSHGKPIPHLSKNLQTQLQLMGKGDGFGSPKILVTISHCKGYATAVAIHL